MAPPERAVHAPKTSVIATTARTSSTPLIVLAPAPLIVAAARPIISRALVEHNFPPISYLREAICNYSATPNLISMTGVCI